MTTQKTYEGLSKEFNDNMAEYIHTGSDKFLRKAVEAMAGKVEILEGRIAELTENYKASVPVQNTVNVRNENSGKKPKEKPIEQITE